MTPLKIDFVSDVVCPWCAVGLLALEQALARVGDSVKAELHFQPFELNPDMPELGERLDEHLRDKYGGGNEQFVRTHEALRQRGEQLGFIFDMQKRTHIYNTFDAHRLLHWAAEQGRQLELKHTLLKTYFTAGQNVSDHGVLLEAVAAVGLDTERARQILASNEFAAQVRARERFYQMNGIHAVPAIIINERHLLQGAQPVEVFEQVLRRLANQSEEAEAHAD